MRLGICLGFYFMSMWSLSGQLVQEFQVTYGDGSLDTFSFRQGNTSNVPDYNLQNVEVEWVSDMNGSYLVCDSVAADLSSKIALVDRGVCLISDKYDHVAEAGAIGFILCNSDNSELVTLGNMGPPFIPAGMMSQGDCDQFKLKLDADTRINWIYEYILDCSDEMFAEIDSCVNAFDLGVILDCPFGYTNAAEAGVSTLCNDNPQPTGCYSNEYGSKWYKFTTGVGMTNIEIQLSGYRGSPFLELYEGSACSLLSDQIICLYGDSIHLVSGLKSETEYYCLIGTDGKNLHSNIFVHIKNADCDYSIKGSAFHDENNNGVKDSLEATLSNIKFQHSKSGRIFYSDENGAFLTHSVVGLDTFGLSPEETCWRISDSTDVYYNSSEGTEQCMDIGLVRTGNEDEDFTIRINAAPTRCNTLVNFWVTIENTECAYLTGPVTVFTDSLVSNLQSTEGDFLVMDSVLMGNLDSLSASGIQTLHFQGMIADENFEGDTIRMSAVFQGDTIHFKSAIRCAIDPNDKQVSPSRDYPNNYTLNSEKLTYKIRFQNTGSDTAYTVAVKDTLSEYFDLSTIAFTATSHTGVFSVDDGVLTMAFENIYLVDSTTNEAESHGFFEFEIGLKEGVEDFTIIENTAYIYFDFNDPIVTNTTQSTIVDELDADTDGYFFWEECDDTKFNVNPGNPEIPNNDVDENCDGVIEVFTAEECNVVFEDFNSFEEGVFVGQSGAENWMFRNVESQNGSISNWGAFNVLDIGSNFNQSSNQYDAQIVQTLSLEEPEIIEISFNYYNECGIVSLEFYEDSAFSTFADLVITSYDSESFNQAYYIQGDTFPSCHIIPNDFVNYTLQLDFIGDELRLLCPMGDTLKVPFYMDASDFYGIGWGSNQCAYISDICISSEESAIVDMDADGFGEDVDCDDNNAAINPDAEEIPNNEIDENCDGIALIIDEDQDGFNSDEDCDDNNAAINPEAEEIPGNDVDENCDGEILTSGIGELGNENIDLYPNPVSDRLIIDHVDGSFSAELLRMDGRRVLLRTSLSNNSSLDLSTLPEGMYLLKLSMESAGESKVFRVVKI